MLEFVTTVLKVIRNLSMHVRALPDTPKVRNIKFFVFTMFMHDIANLIFVSASLDVRKTKIFDLMSNTVTRDSVPNNPRPTSPNKRSTFSLIAFCKSLALYSSPSAGSDSSCARAWQII